MKTLFIPLLMLLSLLPASAQERVLFIGNSLTYYNDMPQLFAGVAAAKGHEVEVESFTIGGSGLAALMTTDEVQRLIRSGHWDRVVLQPGTGETAGRSLATDELARMIRRFIADLHDASPDARVYLYEISNGIAPGDGSGDYASYLYSQQRILDTVTRIARLSGLPLAPAGECFREHYSSHHDLMLHASFNDVHPNLAGSYLVACAIFETLFEEAVAPCAFHSTLADGQAEYLQQVADNVVLPRREEWLMGPGEGGSRDTVGIRPAAPGHLRVYPNPTTGPVHVDANGEVLVTDCLGRETRMTADGGTLDLSAFAPGVYVLQAAGRKQRLVVARPRGGGQ